MIYDDGHFKLIHISLKMSPPVFLLAIFIAICSFSSAIYNHSYEATNVKMITENDWPSHGPWIVTIGN